MASPRISPVGHELLDDPHADPRTVATSLGNIARANFWFGGRAAVRFGLARLLADVPPGRTLTLLDIGTGSGDLPRDAMRWAAGRGIGLAPVGLERSRTAARLAGAAAVPTVVGCAGALPFADRAFDLVLMSQVAHHLAADATVDLFRSAARVARIGVVVADLRRARLAQLLFEVGARLLRFDRVTRVDGVTSIARGYRPAELAALAARAGARAQVRPRPGYRVVAWWRTA
jgi:predicted nicotinamide N-methyase